MDGDPLDNRALDAAIAAAAEGAEIPKRLLAEGETVVVLDPDGEHMLEYRPDGSCRVVGHLHTGGASEQPAG